MKFSIFLTLFLWASTAALLFSQAHVTASCKYKHLTFYAEKGEGLTQGGMAYTIYLVKDSLRQSIDTIGKYGAFFDRELCACTDTSVVFYDLSRFDLSGGSSLKHYYFYDHKWNRSFTWLPGNDLANVGMITPGKKYKKYQHNLITPEKVVSEMKIKEGGENGSLKLIGSYEVEFTLSSDKKSYVLSKETLKKE